MIVISWSIQFWTYFFDFSSKLPPLVSDHFLVHQGRSLTRELTVYLQLFAREKVFSRNFSIARQWVTIVAVKMYY